MAGTAIEFSVGDGVLSGLDFGGHGVGVLLVHGSGHNAAAWTDVASHLVAHCHPVAVDLRGHGQSAVESDGAEQYWRDLGSVVAALSWERPVLVGHSTGGYAVTAVAASGLVKPAMVCVVDGLVLDDRDTSATSHAALRTPDAMEQLREAFRYGWRADDEQRSAYAEQCVRTSPTDRLNAGARPELVREVTLRSFVRRDGAWERRPTIEEMLTVTDVDPSRTIFPSVDLYDRITCPLTVVLADNGFYAPRRAEVQAVVEAVPDRRLIDISSNHNVVMTRPRELATILLDLLPGQGVS